MLSNNAGEAVVTSWDRDVVKVEATHSDRETVEVQTADQTLRIRSRATRGPSGLIDYRLTVPRWMPVNLSGSYLEAAIEGTTAEVTVETVHGNVRVSRRIWRRVRPLGHGRDHRRQGERPGQRDNGERGHPA